MAITVPARSSSSVTPRELLHWCDGNVDPLDQDSILNAADMLYALHNNRSFLSDAICSELKHMVAPGSSRQISPQSIMFGGGDVFAIRANIWSPPDSVDPRSRVHQDQVYSYLIPHDHNFGLLTVGYQGPGYSTVIHEYDRGKVEGYPGERIEMPYLETTTLSKGKVMYYRPSSDIHAQLHPDQVSISLNLLIEHPQYREKTQYEFDVPDRRIVGLLRGTGRFRQTALFEFMDLLGDVDDNAIEIVEHLAATHVSRYVRMAAYNTLGRQRPARAREFINGSMGREPSTIVRAEMARIADGQPGVFASWARE